ncbi:MAG: DNA-directed RNA polymerase subunit omega [Bacillota bacterium]|nr:DNA-directed RNA polymerase subunit omega [Bacillota bacterium]
MHRPSVDDMINGKVSKYSLVIAVAKRAREIAADFDDGYVHDEKPVIIATEEFKDHKYAILEPDEDE